MEKQDVPYKIISNLKSTFVIPSRRGLTEILSFQMLF